MLLETSKMPRIPMTACQAVQGHYGIPKRWLATTRTAQFILPQLDATSPASSRDRAHVGQVHQFLQDRGILKVTLKFADNGSRYLESLVRSLHEYHGHGLPITHSASRGWFWDVRPLQSPSPATAASAAANPSSPRPLARSETMKTFPWHTDCSYETEPPHFFALHILREDQCGGGVLSVLPVASLLARLSPSAQESLCKAEFQIQVPPEFIKSESEASIVGPILSLHRSTAGLRLREDIVTPLTDRAGAAMDEIRVLLDGSDIESDIVRLEPSALPAGSVIFLDNRRWLHARSEVRDPNRHLRRVRWGACAFN